MPQVRDKYILPDLDFLSRNVLDGRGRRLAKEQRPSPAWVYRERRRGRRVGKRCDARGRHLVGCGRRGNRRVGCILLVHSSWPAIHSVVAQRKIRNEKP